MELHHARPQSILTGSALELLEQIITHVRLISASLVSLFKTQAVVHEGPGYSSL